MTNDAPRRLSERGAGRTLGTLIIAGALAVTILEITAGVLGTRAVSPVVVACTATLLVCGIVVLLAPESLPQHLVTVLTPLSIPLIVAINLATEDAGGGAQVAFVLPVVYAGAFRSARLTAWTTVLAVAGVLTTTFSQLSVNQAVMDSVLVTIAIVALATILQTGRRRQDELVAALERLASVDPLTGLATRRVLDERAAEITSGELGVGLLVLDIDHFKAVNDVHGHPAGDLVLSAVGAAVQAEVRAGDTVARLGGDEFAVLFPQIDRADLEARADAVRAAVAGAIALRGPAPVTVTVSCGAAHGPAHSTGPERLYRVADAALYEAKRSGRDRVVVVDASPESESADDRLR